MKQPLTYKLLVREEPEGGYTAFVPTLEGCVTHGDTLDEAIHNAKEAAEVYIESLQAHGETIPTEQRTFEYSLTFTP